MKDKDAGFEDWYARYPRKKARQDALKAWRQTFAARPPLAVMLKALDQAMREWAHRAPEHMPYPATYLRAHCWLDEPDAKCTAPEAEVSPAVALAQQQREAAVRRYEADGLLRLRELEARRARERGSRPQLARSRSAPAPVTDLLGDVVPQLKRGAA